MHFPACAETPTGGGPRRAIRSSISRVRFLTFAASSECSSTVRGCHHAPAAINRTAATLRRLNSSDFRLPAEVALDRIPELRGEVERLPLVAQEDVVTL